MKRVLSLLVPLILVLSGCIISPNPKQVEPTGKAISVKQIQQNCPVELKNYVNSLGTSSKVTLKSELSCLKSGESIFIEKNKNSIEAYGFGYELTLPKALSIGESIKANWFHKEATITFSSSNTVTIQQGNKTIKLKNFNKYPEISNGFNVEFINNGKLSGIKIYNTQPMPLAYTTKLYNA